MVRRAGDARPVTCVAAPTCYARALKMLAIAISFMSAGVVVSSCSSPVTIWSAEARSIDGTWTAVARSLQITGPGNDAVETTVDIQQAGQSSTTVLRFSDAGSSMALQMRWIGSSHLDVTYTDPPKVLYYQVVRTSGVVITVHNIRGEADGG